MSLHPGGGVPGLLEHFGVWATALHSIGSWGGGLKYPLVGFARETVSERTPGRGALCVLARNGTHAHMLVCAVQGTLS